MATPKRMPKAFAVAFALSALGVSQLHAGEKPIFRVSFDKSVVQADAAGGSPRSPDLTEGLMLRMYKGRGDKGQGMYLSGGEQVRSSPKCRPSASRFRRTSSATRRS